MVAKAGTKGLFEWTTRTANGNFHLLPQSLNFRSNAQPVSHQDCPLTPGPTTSLQIRAFYQRSVLVMSFHQLLKAFLVALKVLVANQLSKRVLVQGWEVAGDV